MIRRATPINGNYNEERIYMNNWLFPCNVKQYDPIGAFAELQNIDWRQSVKLEVGDEVFIYCSKPYQRIMFRTIVKECNIPSSKVDKSDLKFSKDNEEIGKEPRFGYAKLHLLNCRDREELSLKSIVKYGIEKAPQGPMKISDELYGYLTQYLC